VLDAKMPASLSCLACGAEVVSAGALTRPWAERVAVGDVPHGVGTNTARQ